jgi:hypothetical protein
MNHARKILGVTLLAVTASSPIHASQDPPPPAQLAQDLRGLHNFDFLKGDWKVHHHRLKERLMGSHEWTDFEGTCSMRQLMDGWSNVDDNVMNMPGGAYRGVGLRAYDPKTGQWAIWWLDSRNPHGAMDPPVKGQFENGVGSFYADDTLRGKPVRVRYTWSQITPNSAHWEQAYSPDGGKSWETNWKMEFERTK